MKIINTYFIYFVLLVGCNSFEKSPSKLKLTKFEVLPPSLLSSHSAPDFIFNLGSTPQIQINHIPHPFNMNGHSPCAVWINGQEVDLTPSQAQILAKILNLKSYPPIDDKKLHEGIGWLQPLTDIK